MGWAPRDWGVLYPRVQTGPTARRGQCGVEAALAGIAGRPVEPPTTRAARPKKTGGCWCRPPVIFHAGGKLGPVSARPARRSAVDDADRPRYLRGV